MINNKFGNKRMILFAVSALLIIAIFIVLLFVLLPKKSDIFYEIHYEGISGKAVIFREEKFFDLSSYEKVLYENLVEGQYLNDDQRVAVAYKKGYIKTTLEKLNETEKNIVTYQNQNIITAFDDKKIQNYDFEIAVIIKRMSEEKNGYIELHSELCRLINSRREHVRNTYNTESNNYLQGLYSDEITMAESLLTWCDEFNSQRGFIGFYCDGFESELNIEKVQNISYKENESLLKTQYQNDLNGYKIVNDSKWYITMKVDDSSLFSIGSCYPVYVGNEKECEAGTLENIINDRNGDVLIFSFADNVEKYLDMRTTDAFVGQRFEGYALKKGYVKNGEVTIKINKKKQSVPVNVLFQNDDIIIFDVNEQLTLGQKVYK